MLDEKQREATESPLFMSGLWKTYPGTDEPALRDVSLRLTRGERLSLLGPSGSGKSTLLHILAGFLKADRGEVYLNGEDASRLPPQHRGIGLVFQDLALFPHLTVTENIAFGLRMAKKDKKETASKVREMLELVGLQRFGNRLPVQLSGGQRQRVAVARALATDPAVLLLDEPFGALDTRLREGIRREIMSIQDRTEVPTVLVTHDQEEALEFGHRVALFESGRLVQLGSAEVVYRKPASLFAARFIGDGSFLDCQVTLMSDAEVQVSRPGFTAALALCHLNFVPTEGQKVLLFTRPHSWEVVEDIAKTQDLGNGALFGSVIRSRFNDGSFVNDILVSDPGGGLITAVSSSKPREQSSVLLRLKSTESISLFPLDDDSF